MSSSTGPSLVCLLVTNMFYYSCRIDAANPNPAPKAFDIPIDVDDVALKAKLQEAYVAITQGDATEIQALDEKVRRYSLLCAFGTYHGFVQTTQIISQINALSLKREFCKSYAANPHQFIHRWIASQARDLDVILGTYSLPSLVFPVSLSLSPLLIAPFLGQGGMAGTGNAKPQVSLGDEDLRRSEFFRLPWVSLNSRAYPYFVYSWSMTR
jgi:hypothetical protein